MTAYREPQQERSRRTFDTLLDATGELLGEVGVERISTNLICERAQVTPPALYRYFDDKYAIILALAERLLKRQNAALDVWLDRYGDAGLVVLSDKIVELLQTMSEITGSQPGAIWIMRALRSVPSMTPVRLFSHNYVADRLTDTYQRYLPHVDREVLRRRCRLSVELGYSLDEMLKEEDANQQRLIEDMAFLLRAMIYYPDYRLDLPPLS